MDARATANRPAMGFAGLATLVSTVPNLAPAKRRREGVGLGVGLGLALLAVTRFLTQPVTHVAPIGPIPQLTQENFTPLNFATPTFPPSSLQQQPGSPAALAAPSFAAPPASGLSSISEVKPPPGTDLTLSASQILYCLAQKIRLDTIEPIVDLKSAAQVSGFNGLVDDYDLRCLSYHYRGTDMEVAQRRVELLRAALATEAKAQIAAWH